MDEVCNSQPKCDELELVLFGPGYGECILLHVGGGCWLVVDSCLDDKSQPVSLRYLRELGIDPSVAIKAVVATHWHEDHIRGMANILELCPRAEFCCAGALAQREFLSMVDLVADDTVPRSGLGAREFKKVLTLLKERDHIPLFAGQNRKLFQFGDCEIWSVSPTDDAFNAFLNMAARQVSDSGVTTKRIFAPSPNQLSIVLTVHDRSTAVLLGADLHKKGWARIVNDFPHSCWRASLYKASHHGSKTGSAPEVWNELLTSDPYVVLTPWQRGGKAIPTEDDVGRILQRTRNAWITLTQATRPKRKGSRPKAVEKTLRGKGTPLKPLHSAFGYIQLRRRMNKGKEWTVVTRGHAGRLKDFSL